jgi:hypothetical protein
MAPTSPRPQLNSYHSSLPRHGMTDHQHRQTLHQPVMKLALPIPAKIREIHTGGMDSEGIKTDLIHRW